MQVGFITGKELEYVGAGSGGSRGCMREWALERQRKRTERGRMCNKTPVK